jgi:hypothetical protein
MSFNRINFQREVEAPAAPAAVVPVTPPAETKFIPYREDKDEVTEEVTEETPEEITAREAAEALPPVAIKTTETKPADVVPPVPPVTPAVPVPEDVKPVDWKAALKTADKWEALKELGYDEFTIGMLKYKEQTGDYTPYLQVKTIDYSKMTAEQLLKLDLANKNKGMSERALNFKFNKEFSEKYYLNREDYPEDSDEAIFGEEQLRLDAEAKRKEFIDEQVKFKAPEAAPDTEAPKRNAEIKERQEKQRAIVLNSPITKALQTAKAISFGVGEESFNYPITNVQAIIDNAMQTVLNSETLDIKDAEMTNFYKLLAIGLDVDGFEKSLADHYRGIGKKKVQAEIQNVTPLVTTTGEQSKDMSPAQQLARNGRIV